MKLSKLFHTLYATVMALPVLVIPIFALNILHKETEPISIEVQEKISVDFNQKIVNGSFENGQFTPWYEVYPASSDYTINNGVLTFNYDQVNGQLAYRYSTIINHYYITKLTFKGDGSYYGFNGEFTGGTYSEDTILQNRFQSTYQYRYLVINHSGTTQGTFQVTCFQCYDLTQMFGEGNEPTLQEFNSMFTNAYYPYTESQKMLVNKPTTTTFNNTDIGSQFIYALYKPVHDYFNFGDFFGLGGMYDWFQLNIFNGTSPLTFFIVFNVMIYWLFISLFWLLFDILIYVPMVIHKWLDKAEM